ncbi:MAG: hypothetical protein HOQ24_10170 [Mycobacteriaceae bacterium]|nr:hypothetical protein [Mycobacteriaceae bacterium]
MSQILGLLLTAATLYATIYPDRSRRIAPEAAAALKRWRESVDSVVRRVLGSVYDNVVPIVGVALSIGLVVVLVVVGLHTSESPGTRGEIAGDIRNFTAPLAATIINVIGMGYLFGKDDRNRRSFAGWLGSFVFAMLIFVLIKWGDVVLEDLGALFRHWAP